LIGDVNHIAFNLGDLYVEGKDASFDYVTAYMWYSLGSAGDPRAAVRL
jgi:TPR repeat protein